MILNGRNLSVQQKLLEAIGWSGLITTRVAELAGLSMKQVSGGLAEPTTFTFTLTRE